MMLEVLMVFGNQWKVVIDQERSGEFVTGVTTDGVELWCCMVEDRVREEMAFELERE